MSNHYKRRTYEEAEELARLKFLSIVEQVLSPVEIEEIRMHALKTGGTPKTDWESSLGFVPTEDSYYEIELYKPADARPYIEKSFVRMLVPRSRGSEEIHFIWREKKDMA